MVATVGLRSQLEERTVPPDAHAHGKAALNVLPDFDDRVLDGLTLVFDQVFEPPVLPVATIELREEGEPVLLTVRDLVEDLLHLGGELEVDEVTEVRAEQVRDRERGVAGDQRLPLPRDVPAALNGRHGRGVRRRTPDAFLLEPLDE